VSHSKIRTEKICLNCGTDTPGRYCPACGQENIEPKQSVWHLVNHFFSDITHFDGKFFLTVKDLFAKPGFLSKEYMAGRRANYLDPIRMYIFTSAFFFLIFFSLFNVKNIHFGEEARSEINKDSGLAELLSHVKSSRDSLRIMKAYQSKAGPFAKSSDDSTITPRNTRFNFGKGDYPTIEAYDSAQKALPPDQRDGWLKRKISTKKIELNLRYQKEQGNLFREMLNNYVHNCPKVLFISLPLFALLLKLLYIRRKQFYYVDHGIFSVHLYIFSFLLLLVLFGINALQNHTGWRWLDWLFLFIILYPIFYNYKAMRRFYGQSRRKTILKYILLFILSFFVQLIIFTGAILFTVFEA
jgi:hypothetical protein